MWRPVVGALLALVGVTWFLQGIDVLGGSGMSGHPIWAVLGVVLVVAAVYVVAGAQVRRRRGR